ncbi:MAG: endonuclease/exonuclease/phosphatase family protein, partial [Gemmatimonadota bacterium]
SNPFEPATDGIDFYESLEGMRVVVAAPVAVSPTATFGDGATGEVFTLVERGAHAVPDDARTAAGGILLQPHPDNRGDQNPERVQVQFEAGVYPDAVPEMGVGDRLGDVIGVVGYSFGNYEVLATETVEVGAAGGAPPGDAPGEPLQARASTELVGTADRVTVATYNVGGMNPLPETDARRALLGEHIAERLSAPDVVALQEIQDASGTRGGAGDSTTDATATLEAVVEAVIAAGGPRYAFLDVAPGPGASGGVPGGNIRNAFLYDSTRVELADARSPGPEELREAGARDPDAFDGVRDPLVGEFSFRGRRFTVVNVHLTSRAGSTPVFGAVQPFVQAGEKEREAQLRALHDYVASLLAEEPEAAVVVLGDMNTFEFTDDLTGILPGRGDGVILRNLVHDVPAADRYTYNFEGNSQALDHVFVTEGLADGAGVDVLHLNADAFEADRASDHDPVVVRLQVP